MNRIETPYTRVAVISDIHSNVLALDAAISSIRNLQAQAVICLGDLLTYGPHPIETIERLTQLQTELPTFFIIGNHDQFYFQSQQATLKNVKPLPDFIEASMLWHLETLPIQLEEQFDWLQAVAMDEIYFAHANPFEFGNWTYLRDENSLNSAATTLKDMGFRYGCFGHTHRYEQYAHAGVQIFNPGSLGQPRGTEASFGVLSRHEQGWHFEKIPVHYPLDQHLADLNRLPLSLDVKEKLKSYFTEVIA